VSLRPGLRRSFGWTGRGSEVDARELNPLQKSSERRSRNGPEEEVAVVDSFLVLDMLLKLLALLA